MHSDPSTSRSHAADPQRAWTHAIIALVGVGSILTIAVLFWGFSGDGSQLMGAGPLDQTGVPAEIQAEGVIIDPLAWNKTLWTPLQDAPPAPPPAAATPEPFSGQLMAVLTMDGQLTAVLKHPDGETVYLQTGQTERGLALTSIDRDQAAVVYDGTTHRLSLP